MNLVQCVPNTSSYQNSKISLFADDTTLAVDANNISNLETKAFAEANSVLQWANQNKLVLNSAKTKIIEFKISQAKHSENISYILGSEEIVPNSVVKYLGIQIDSGLKFHSHIDSVCNKLSSGIFTIKTLS